MAKPAPADENGRHGLFLPRYGPVRGSEQELEYKHHLEANYCVSGEGEVVDVASGEVYPIRSGTLYALDKNDRHILRATKGELRLICVFYPALIGTEVHQPDGSYTAPEPDR